MESLNKSNYSENGAATVAAQENVVFVMVQDGLQEWEWEKTVIALHVIIIMGNVLLVMVEGNGTNKILKLDI